MNPKALIIIAFEGFRDEEYSIPKTILEENGAEITVASWQTGLAIGKFGLQVHVDMDIKDIDTSVYDAIIFVGGPGSKKLWDNSDAHLIARNAFNYGKVIAAICSAPVILARSGVLAGKSATCYPNDANEIKKHEAVYTGKPLEQDGLIITADGPDSAGIFGSRIAQILHVI